MGYMKLDCKKKAWHDIHKVIFMECIIDSPQFNIANRTRLEPDWNI